MEKLTQKYCIVSLLEESPVGFEFARKDWPLHVTFVGVHFTDWKNSKLLNSFDALCKSTKPIKAKPFKRGKLGTVTTDYIEPKAGIVNLHNSLIDMLESFNATFINRQWSREGYTPHCTVQMHGALNNKLPVLINNLALIDMYPQNNANKRKILKINEIGAHES